MKSLGWALIQYNWCLYKKRSGHSDTLKEDYVKTQGKDNHLQAKERGLRRNYPGPHLDLRLLASRTKGQYIPAV